MLVWRVSFIEVLGEFIFLGFVGELVFNWCYIIRKEFEIFVFLIFICNSYLYFEYIIGNYRSWVIMVNFIMFMVLWLKILEINDIY